LGNLIDTSIDYGRREELIGRYIAQRRSEYFLASKCGCVPGAGMAAEHIHTAENIRAGVENSLLHSEQGSPRHGRCIFTASGAGNRVALYATAVAPGSGSS